MVSNAVKEVTEQDRRKLLAGFLYDMAKLMFGSVAVGGIVAPVHRWLSGNCQCSVYSFWLDGGAASRLLCQ